MTEPYPVRETKILHINYGTYCIGHNERGVPEAAVGHEGLVFPGVSGDGGALVRTGTFSGPVTITVETCDLPPEPLEKSLWEMADEVLLVSAGHEVVVWELFGVGEGLPRLTTAPGQRYRVRVSAHGFSVGTDAGDVPRADKPVESHLVQLWPDTD